MILLITLRNLNPLGFPEIITRKIPEEISDKEAIKIFNASLNFIEEKTDFIGQIFHEGKMREIIGIASGGVIQAGLLTIKAERT